MINFFSVPNKEKNYQSYMVFVLAILWSVVSGIIVSFGFYFFADLWLRWATFLGIALLISLVNLTLNYLGYTRLASIVLTIMLWLFITIPCYSAGGMISIGILSQMSVILTAGFLLGWRGGLAIGLLTMGTDFWFAYLEFTGNLPIPSVHHTPITRWIGAIIPFATILALQYYATDHLRSSLNALQREIVKREKAEKIAVQTVHNLKERVKELKTLSDVSHILQDEDAPIKTILQKIVEILPAGWQYPEITAARICFAGSEYKTINFESSAYHQQAEIKTDTGAILNIEIIYLAQKPEFDEGPFLKEERSLINMLAEMVKINLERRERSTELKDYKYALDISSMISISGSDTCFTFVNDNFCKGTKYNSNELLGKNYNLIMSDYHKPAYFQELNSALQSGKPYRGEFCNKAKDGSLYWVDTSVVPFLDENGKVYQYLSINYDITERKAAEEAIKKSEEKYHSLIEHAADAIFQVDENNAITDVNQSACELLGYSREELQSMKPADIYPSETSNSYTQVDWEVLNKNKTLIDERTLQRKDGSKVIVDISKKLLADGKGYLGIVRDITERKAADEKIKQSEQLLKKITSQIPSNTYIFDIEESGDAQILFMSIGKDTFNIDYNFDNVSEHPELLRGVVYEGDKVKFNDAMKEGFKTQLPINFQYRIVINGNIRWRWMQASPEKDKTGKVLWYGASNDITPLVEYIASTEQIIFDISHVIRRPVSSMLGLSKFIIDSDLNQDEIKDMSQKLYHVSQEMDKFIHELNDVYIQKRKNTELNIDISDLIDKRNFLFH